MVVVIYCRLTLPRAFYSSNFGTSNFGSDAWSFVLVPSGESGTVSPAANASGMVGALVRSPPPQHGRDAAPAAAPHAELRQRMPAARARVSAASSVPCRRLRRWAPRDPRSGLRRGSPRRGARTRGGAESAITWNASMATSLPHGPHLGGFPASAHECSTRGPRRARVLQVRGAGRMPRV